MFEVEDILYRRSCEPLLCCLSEEETSQVLEELHERICVFHERGRMLVYKIIRMGYFYTTIKRDAKNFVKSVELAMHDSPTTLQCEA